MNKGFFFDTADIDYIKKTWDKISKHVNCSDVFGITTNPNAMFKENLDTIDKWVKRVNLLCEFVHDVNSLGLVYIQGPNSEMSVYDIKKFIGYFSEIKYPDLIGIKIPPFYPILKRIYELSDFYPNVTGIADCGTALNCLLYNPRYISIIPGRMEEKGIDAKAHVGYVEQQPSCMCVKRVITGSMRTLEGLKWAIEYGTVPTIGTKVWDEMLEKNKVEEFSNYWSVEVKTNHKFSPLISYDNTQLSIDFFNQMDTVGKKTYEDFSKKYDSR